MTAELLAVLIDPDWDHCEQVAKDIALLFYCDGIVRFDHICDRSKRDAGVVRCAPELSPGHTVQTYAGKTTVTPSILCDDCGTHGFVTGGAWRPC